jgi:hypothetical protein
MDGGNLWMVIQGRQQFMDGSNSWTAAIHGRQQFMDGSNLWTAEIHRRQ